LEANSLPMVFFDFSKKVFLVNLIRMFDFPTPLSPKISVKDKFYQAGQFYRVSHNHFQMIAF